MYRIRDTIQVDPANFPDFYEDIRHRNRVSKISSTLDYDVFGFGKIKRKIEYDKLDCNIHPCVVPANLCDGIRRSSRAQCGFSGSRVKISVSCLNRFPNLKIVTLSFFSPLCRFAAGTEIKFDAKRLPRPIESVIGVTDFSCVQHGRDK